MDTLKHLIEEISSTNKDLIEPYFLWLKDSHENYDSALKNLEKAAKVIKSEIRKAKRFLKDHEAKNANLKKFKGYDKRINQNEIQSYFIDYSFKMVNNSNVQKYINDSKRTFSHMENVIKTLGWEKVAKSKGIEVFSLIKRKYIDRDGSLKSSNDIIQIEKKLLSKIKNDFAIWKTEKLRTSDIPNWINSKLDMIFKDDKLIKSLFKTNDENKLKHEREGLYAKISNEITSSIVREHGEISEGEIFEIIDRVIRTFLMNSKSEVAQIYSIIFFGEQIEESIKEGSAYIIPDEQEKSLLKYENPPDINFEQVFRQIKIIKDEFLSYINDFELKITLIYCIVKILAEYQNGKNITIEHRRNEKDKKFFFLTDFELKLSLISTPGDKFYIKQKVIRDSSELISTEIIQLNKDHITSISHTITDLNNEANLLDRDKIHGHLELKNKVEKEIESEIIEGENKISIEEEITNLFKELKKEGKTDIKVFRIKSYIARRLEEIYQKSFNPQGISRNNFSAIAYEILNKKLNLSKKGWKKKKLLDLMQHNGFRK